MCQAMKRTLVLRLLGREIGFRAMYNRVMLLWKAQGDVKLTNLENGFYLARLATEEDYSTILFNGPWSILGHYLTVQLWNSSFSGKEGKVKTIAAWIRLLGLPIQYYHEYIL